MVSYSRSSRWYQLLKHCIAPISKVVIRELCDNPIDPNPLHNFHCFDWWVLNSKTNLCSVSFNRTTKAANSELPSGYTAQKMNELTACICVWVCDIPFHTVILGQLLESRSKTESLYHILCILLVAQLQRTKLLRRGTRQKSGSTIYWATFSEKTTCFCCAFPLSGLCGATCISWYRHVSGAVFRNNNHERDFVVGRNERAPGWRQRRRPGPTGMTHLRLLCHYGRKQQRPIKNVCVQALRSLT